MKKTPFLTRLFVLLPLFVLLGCGPNNQTSVQQDIAFDVEGYLEFMRPDSTIIKRIAIEIAETDSAQARGLMGRRNLPQNGGMLFLNEDSQMRSFWMKNTPVSLDIIFVDSLGQIVNIAKETTPFSEDRITSTAPAQHIVEVRAKFTDRYLIDETTWVRWRRTN